MNAMPTTPVRRAAVVGAGVIGSGWAARFVLNGIDVSVYDPDPELERKLATVLDNARLAMARLLPGVLPAEGKLVIADSIAEAVDSADFIQESLPEREDLKQSILEQIEAAARPTVIIGSSTSGLLPTRLQSGMRHPGRFVVGHPFNPVYLLPLVEVCGGNATPESTVTETEAFYRSLGMHPLRVRKEIDGFIADRLLEAVWREALWLVRDGVATTAEIDDAIRYGAGLRWSFMGTFLIYRIAGGEAGMGHFLSQFGPALKLPWTRLEAPELTDALADRIAQQSDDQAGASSIRDLERLRDDCLVAILSALRRCDFAAGATLRRYGDELAARWPKTKPPVDESQPLALHSATVLSDWIDYNGHMTEARYLEVFGYATDALLEYIGAGPAYVGQGHSFFTVETHIRHLEEASEGERLRVTTQILRSDAKRLHLFHTLVRATDGAVLATGEHMLIHVDAQARRAVAARGEVLRNVERLAKAQAGLAIPKGAGRAVGAPVA
jgi:carnitine 3-dehydrogenase / betainyl-CoA thioesterase